MTPSGFPLVLSLIDRNVAVIAAVSTGAANAARAATSTIPIVALDLETDPVTTGMISSLSRSGGNLTGLFFDFPQFRTKLLELLKFELVINLTAAKSLNLIPPPLLIRADEVIEWRADADWTHGVLVQFLPHAVAEVAFRDPRATDFCYSCPVSRSECVHETT